MRINTNANTLNMLNNLQKTNKEYRSSMEKLSSGNKINKASDDPAGLVISEKMRSKIFSIQQEIENLENMNNKYNTADGNLETSQNSLQEMREIAVAAANEGGNSEETQQVFQNSLENSVKSFNEVKESAEFGSQKLLDGSEASVADVESMSNLDISTSEKAQEAIDTIDKKLDEVSRIRSEIGATQKNDLEARKNNLEIEMTNLTAAESSVRDVDMAKEYSNFVKNEIQLKASMAMLAHQEQVPNLVMDFLSE